MRFLFCTAISTKFVEITASNNIQFFLFIYLFFYYKNERLHCHCIGFGFLLLLFGKCGKTTTPITQLVHALTYIKFRWLHNNAPLNWALILVGQLEALRYRMGHFGVLALQLILVGKHVHCCLVSHSLVINAPLLHLPLITWPTCLDMGQEVVQLTLIISRSTQTITAM